jgi:hypothetical protein
MALVDAPSVGTALLCAIAISSHFHVLAAEQSGHEEEGF